jgi:4-aminobutyrate aminotransferase/diaminobutyrate-pyruvate transaminase/4-aminobutyrate aminotransferase/(S)-3-amino-2-methylpropionate transaminase
VAGYDLTPVDVPEVDSKFRTIRTKLPVPESLPIFEQLQRSEPRSMWGQPPIVWDRADGFTVSDRWGNRWIDWSSGVLISNIGHGRSEIKDALRAILDQGLLATYVFVHEKRAQLTEMLSQLAPDPDNYRTFLLTTGSEACENSIKLAKTYGLEKHGPHKKYLVSFHNAFHGRTMGSQLAGGMEKLKTWMVDRDRTFVQVPFPDGYKNEDQSFDLFLSTLDEKGIAPEEVAGVISESYQGIGPDFFPVDYARQLEAFCREHDIVLIMDEVQAGFGRTGRMFCFEHYGIVPDLIACGKGITSSLPLSAVIGRNDIMNLYPPGSMTSTHSASPLPVVAAVENLRILQNEGIVEHTAQMGEILMDGLARLQERYPEALGCVQGKGLVAGIQVVVPGTKVPDPDTALQINVACYQKGLLMFAPVGIAGECIKIAPPLVISEEALRDSIAVLAEAVEDVVG